MSNIESCHDDLLPSKISYRRRPPRHTDPDGPKLVLSKGRKLLLVPVTLIDKIRPKDVEIVDQVLYWLKIYFNDVQAINHTFMPSLCPSAGANTNFRTQVCQVLSKNVGPGKTVSYSELASMLNKPNAARAVGTAMANNPIQLIIPCHRVIRNDLSLGNYARGQRVKMWLLKHEGVKLAANNKVLPVPGTKKRPTRTVVLP
uniref:Methylated-DNA--protein-cysteine methyltransferase n=1 Tax=Timema cristinae TaxID=61476 RepID=A0A7R9CVW8_TIMCR|nr:unnamed protein product [Timema cristinae]